MRLKRLTRLMKRQNTVDLAVDAYLTWRGECVAVRNAYVAWRCAPGKDAALAFGSYEAALDREEVAANVYADLMRRVGHPVEIALARQLAYLPATPGA